MLLCIHRFLPWTAMNKLQTPYTAYGEFLKFTVDFTFCLIIVSWINLLNVCLRRWTERCNLYLMLTWTNNHVWCFQLSYIIYPCCNTCSTYRNVLTFCRFRICPFLLSRKNLALQWHTKTYVLPTLLQHFGRGIHLATYLLPYFIKK